MSPSLQPSVFTFTLAAFLAGGALETPTAYAEPLVEYPIDAVSNPETQTPLEPIYHHGSGATLAASPLVLHGAHLFDTPHAGEFFGSFWSTDGSFNDVDDYYEFTISAAGGHRWTPTSLAFTLVAYNYSNFIGPAYWGVRASTDGFASVDVGLPMDQEPAALSDHDRHFLRTVSDFGALGEGPFEEVTIRLYGWNSTHSVSAGGLANSPSFTDPGSNLWIEGDILEPPKMNLVEYPIDACSNPEVQIPLGPIYHSNSESVIFASPLDLLGARPFDTPHYGDCFANFWSTDGSFNGVDDYYEFTIEALPGQSWIPEEIAFTLVAYNYSNFIGPAYWGIRASTDDFQSVDVGLAMDQEPAALTDHDRHFMRTVTDFSALGPGPFERITYRLYGWNSTHSVSAGGLGNSPSFTDEGSNLWIRGRTVVPEPGVVGGLLWGVIGAQVLRRRRNRGLMFAAGTVPP